MIRYVLKRLVLAVPLLIGIATVTFSIIALIGIALGSGCRGDPAPGRETVSTLTVLHPGDEGIFGPDWPAKFLVFLPLAERGENGETEGVLASRWERSPDWREWTIHLRPGLRWQDGTPVTAHDIKFTLDLLAHPAVGYTTPDAHTVTVLDDSTYTTTFHKRSWGSPYDYWTVYWPKHLLEGLDPAEFWQWEFWTRPVGNGPYRFVRRVPHTMVELSADSAYFRGHPRIERLILKTGRDYGDETR